MAISVWGNTGQEPVMINAAAGEQRAPAVADNGGTELAVAWIDPNEKIIISFYNEMGELDPATPPAVVTDGLYGDTSVESKVNDVQIVAGGEGTGYGIIWEETPRDESGPSILRLRYHNHVTGSLLGGEVAVGNPGAHDAAISGYSQDDPQTRKPNVDGFDVAWVEGPGGAHSVGTVYVQRFAVPLDSRKDPISAPAPVGLDGRPTSPTIANPIPDAAVPLGQGRDPSVAGLIAGNNETVVTWIGADNNINLRIFSDTGATLVSSSLVNATVDNEIASPSTQQHVTALPGGGFVVAWIANPATGANAEDGNVLMARVFTPGAAAGTFTAGGVITLDTLAGNSDGILDFSLAALPDSGGFSVTWTADDNGTQALHTRSYDDAGTPQEGTATVVHAHADSGAFAVATTGLVGDRYIAVYQETSGTDAGNVTAQIFDTRENRSDPVNPQPIVLNGPGLALTGDPDFEARGRAAPDVLVGTIGNDTINGRLSDDIMDGGLGDDLIFAGAGNDVADGGGGIDTVRFTGAKADYTIVSLGNGLFTITDKRAGSPDGTDTVRNVEKFEFTNPDGTHETVEASTLSNDRPNVTPSAWGWTNEDADVLPNAEGTPDTDGWIVNDATTAGVQTNPFVADSVGEFLAVVYETASTQGAPTRIEGRFYDVIGNADEFIPNALAISDGIGIETNPVAVSGGANSGWGVAWEEVSSAADKTGEIHTNFVGPGVLTSSEITVFAKEGYNGHDIAMSGSFLDRTKLSPVGGSTLPVGMNEGYNVAWVATQVDGQGNAIGGDARYGEVLFQRYEVPLDALGNPGAPVAGGADGIAGLDGRVISSANDGAVTLSTNGRNPSTAGLHTFETGVAWIEKQEGGTEKVVFKAYDDLGNIFYDNPDLSAGFPVAANTNVHVVSAGAVNFGIVWITKDDVLGTYKVVATMLSSPGNGLDGEGFTLGAPSQIFELMTLPPGSDPTSDGFQVTGISGEDSEDLIVSWKQIGDGLDVMAQHISVVLDPVTGIALSMAPEGNIVTVNASTLGTQDHASIAGMLGDRFVAVYQDNGSYTHGGTDIVGRILDTRDAQNPEPISGDLVRPDGGIQARRDVIVGTNGNDDIQGDISDSDGLVDWIYAGMGDDRVQGGPGLRGAAGVPEIIDGGDGTDTAVYTGRRTDYSITINGDGSVEVRDLRPTQDAQGNELQHDGIDNLYSIEKIQFLDTANNGEGAETLTIATPGGAPGGAPGTPPPLNHIDGADQGPYSGTPLVWSLDDTSQYKEVEVDHGTGAQTGIAATNLQDGAALAWVSGDGKEIWAISYDTTGAKDPVLLDKNTQLTDGGEGGIFTDNTVSDIDLSMSGGLGVTAVWTSTDTDDNDSGDAAIHLAFASTNTHVVLEPNGGVPGPGIPGGEIVVTESAGDGVASAPVVQGYEIVNLENDTLEVGVHVGFVMKENASDVYGTLTMARYEIPVYELAVDADGVPVTDANGQGVLARDAAGNLIPSTPADFGTGSETKPISIGLDGQRGTSDDGVGIVLTEVGLVRADDPRLNSTGADKLTAVQGRDLNVGTLHDNQLVVTYVGTDEKVHLRIFLPDIKQDADRDMTDGDGGVTAIGITTYRELGVPAGLTANLGTVASGQAAYLIPQQNGSFGVFWAADLDGTPGGKVAIQGIIYAGAGSNWSATAVRTFSPEGGLPADTRFQIAPTGVTPGGLEDGYFVSWETTDGIRGQRFDMTGGKVGDEITVGDPTTNLGSGTPILHASTGIDDGRMLVGYQEVLPNGDINVSAQFLDNREPGVALIGPRTGAPADVIAGTVGDDAIDGRSLDDALSGGLGNDLLTLGTGNDIGYGGRGNDTIVGGVGQDQLLGEDGDDLLWGGLNAPGGESDQQIDRLLPATPQFAGFAGQGVDLISGGEGIDTVSYRGEVGRFDVDLERGTTLSDRAIRTPGPDGSLPQITNPEDVFGKLEEDDTGNILFVATRDIENVEGADGNDILRGDGQANVLDGRGGNDILEGRKGDDTLHGGAGSSDVAVFSGDVANYRVTQLDATHYEVRDVRVDGDGVDVLDGVEMLQFADVTLDVAAAAGRAGQPFALKDISFKEIGQAPVPVQVDGASGSFTFTVTDPNSPFEIVDGSLQLKEAASVDFETVSVYEVPVDVTGDLTPDRVLRVLVGDVNEAPTALSVSKVVPNGGVAEDHALPIKVANLSFTDPDTAAAFVKGTYSVDNDAFEVRAGSGGGKELWFVGAKLDFETAPVLNVTVTVADAGAAGAPVSQAFTVQVKDVNEAPTDIGLSNLAASSNDAGTIVGVLTATDQDAHDVLTFSVDPASPFKVVTDETGVHLALASDVTADTDVEVTVTDAGGLSYRETFHITVPSNGPGDPGPTDHAAIILVATAASFAENVGGVDIGSLRDANGAALPATLFYTVSDQRFEVVDDGAGGAELRLKQGSQFDFETDTGSLQVAVSASNGVGQPVLFQQAFTLTVTDVNEVSVFAAGTPNLADVDAAAAETRDAGSISFSDPDSGDVHKVTVSPAALGVFAASVDELNGTVAWTFEADADVLRALGAGQTATETVTLTLSDGHVSDSTDVTITLHGVNDSPQATAVTATHSVIEEGIGAAASQTASGTLADNVSDPDSDAAALAVIGLQSSVGTSGTTELKGKYGTLTVNPDLTYTYVLDNTDEDTQGLAQGQIAQDVFTYTVSNGPGAADKASSTIAINIAGTNDGPSLAVAPPDVSLVEAGVAGAGVTIARATLTKTDPDSASVFSTQDWQLNGDGTYSKAGMYGTATFNITSGAITYALDNSKAATQQLKAADIGMDDTFTFAVTDASGASATAGVTFKVNGANDAPTALTLTTTHVPENTPGVVLGTVATTDPDGDTAFTYAFSIGDATDSRFEVVSGQIRLKAGASLLASEDDGKVVTVTSTDPGGASISQTFTLAVDPPNRAPTDITFTGGSVLENSAAGTLVLTLATVDPDRGEAFTYSIAGADASLFIVEGNQVKVAPGVQIDFEAQATREIDVTTHDQGGVTFTEHLTIAIGNVSGNITGTRAGEPVTGTAEEDTIRAGAGADTVSGLAGDDFIFGDAGNDRMDGGKGADTLHGGVGNDTYVISNQLDTIVENAGEGTDTVESSVSFSLASLANVENVTLTGTRNVSATGNAGVNVLTGNSGANRLNGGAGGDTMRGGDGDDTYIVDSTGDVLRENVNQGVDTVMSSVAFRLGSSLENLTLTGTASTGTGNALANEIRGNASNNILDGALGDDSLSGLAGSDTLIGSRGSDTLSGGRGNDTLTGGADNDVFVFETGTQRDTVTDFRNGQDRIDVSSFIDTEAELTAFLNGLGNVQAVGRNVEIHHTLAGGGEDVLVLTGVTRAQIDATDFII